MKVMQSPEISVLMPVRNCERFLPESVESILGQTFRKFEFIVLDDGSTDRSASMLDKFRAMDPRVRVLQGPGVGLTHALNICLGAAKGRYIARMDADDVATPRRLEMQFGFLEMNSDYVLVGGQVMLIDAEGVPIGFRYSPSSHAEIERLLLAGDSSCITHPAILMRAGSLASIGGYDTRFRVAQDLQLYLALGLKGKLKNLREEVLHYRQHKSSVNYRFASEWQHYKMMAVSEASAARSIPFRPETVGVGARQGGFGSAAVHRSWSRSAISARHFKGAYKHAIAFCFHSPSPTALWNFLSVIYRTFCPRSDTRLP